MNITIFDGTGKIMSWGSVQPECLHVEVKPGMHYVEGEYPSWDYYADMVRGEMVKKPEKPSEGHVWSDVLHEWVASFDRLTEQASERIEAARIARTLAPLAYDGKTLDADEKSQKNLGNRFTSLAEFERRGETMPLDMLFWRDAKNVTHLWPSHALYRDWIGGFVTALDVRESESYVWAWEQKVLRDEAAARRDADALLKIAAPLIPAPEPIV